MKKKTYYEMKIASLDKGIEDATQDLEFLCSLIETPDREYHIPDAVEYSQAVVALFRQLDFMVEDLGATPLSNDQECVKLTRDQLLKLNSLSNEVDAALRRMRKCGISVTNN